MPARGAAPATGISAVPKLRTSTPLGFSFPQTFPNPWGSFETGTLDNFTSNSGPQASVSAPGEGLVIRLSTLTAATWQQEVSWGSGTSFAAPIVSSVVAQMREQLERPSTPAQGAPR